MAENAKILLSIASGVILLLAGIVLNLIRRVQDRNDAKIDDLYAKLQNIEHHITVLSTEHAYLTCKKIQGGKNAKNKKRVD